jgi:hypothetical protein
MKLSGTLYVVPTEENTSADTRHVPSKIRNHDPSARPSTGHVTGNVSYENSAN